MKNKIIAFYDVLIYCIICIPLVALAIFIFLKGDGFSNFNWMMSNWYLVLVSAVGTVSPVVGVIFFRYFQIVNNDIYFHYFPFTLSWKKYQSNIDINWNQNVQIDEIKSVEVVKLSREEKKVRIYYRHLINKYLKINLKSGEAKFVYIGNYSGFQIKKIISLCTINNL